LVQKAHAVGQDWVSGYTAVEIMFLWIDPASGTWFQGRT